MQYSIIAPTAKGQLPKALCWPIFMALVALGMSCASPKSLEYRGLSQVRVEPVTLSTANVHFTLTVYNPNPYPLSIKSWQASLLLNEKEVGQLQSDSALTLPALQEYSYSTKVPVQIGAVLGQGLSLLGSGQIPYAIKGSARAGRKSIKATIPFSYDGQLKIADLLGQ
ncbi:MAG TPA: LEA type 2 family protein [Phnomibacter sp.]|nr:LEA type 2 family protein [Phnomibacter sp.]